MILDVFSLKGQVQGLPRTQYSSVDLISINLTMAGPFEGELRLYPEDLGQVAETGFRVSGLLIKSITIGRGKANVKLRLPCPLHYKNVQKLDVSMTYASNTKKWTVELDPNNWFRHNKNKISGDYGNWMSQLNNDIAIFLSIDPDDGKYEGFPLDKLGVALTPGKWTATNEHYMRSGLLADSAGNHVFMLFPSGDTGYAFKVASPGPKLIGLEAQPLSAKVSNWLVAPVVLGLPLRATGESQGWRSIVSWAPLYKDADQSAQGKRLGFQPIFDALWNAPVNNALAGARLNSAAQPLVPLPRLMVQPDTFGKAAEYCPLLVFEAPAATDSVPMPISRFRHVHISQQDKTPIRADFDLRAPATGVSLTAHQHVLRFQGLIDSSSAMPMPWRDVPSDKGDTNQLMGLFEKATAFLDDPARAEHLMSWNASGHVSVQGLDDSWLVWGSLQVNLAPVPKSPVNGIPASLTCIVRGSWSDASCDAYPESTLTLECRVRVSAAADAADKDLFAAFGTADSFEDRLQRDTDALRIPRGAQQEGRLCSVVIRHRTEPGRNAVTRVQVYSRDHAPFGDESLVIQMRPFSVAMVQPVDIDAEAGELIAVWSSNDPEGVQWRVPDSTATLALQPQAVGEAMERGVRFWDMDDGKPTPRFAPGQPVPYRFSAPTQLVVRPSVRERRYNKSPNNLGAVLAGAKVDSFITEIAYPIEARFQVSDLGLPDVRIRETASMIGKPSENIAALPSNDELDNFAMKRWLREAYAEEVARYAETVPAGKFTAAVASLRGRHAAAKATFAARLAEYHLYDPWSSTARLGLKERVTFRLRDTRFGAPPLLNPLPQWKYDPASNIASPLPTDLMDEQKRLTHRALLEAGPRFLKDGSAPDFVPLWGSSRDGAFPGGAVHTMEFASELVAVLRNPVAAKGEIESLAFSALGATGHMAVSFDEGRTTFVAESAHGQLSRLIKIRIGRIGVVWNKAKHVIVYERTTVASTQFMGEQEYGGKPDDPTDLTGGNKTRGWPILRKTEEYVEPIEMIRAFDNETQAAESCTAFLASSEFVSRRVYVNGAWGRDLGHGYEIPLWNSDDPTGFYPKPQLALRARAVGQELTRCWHDEPQHLVFYTNTETGKGDNPDKWEAQPGVDLPRAFGRLPVVTMPTAPGPKQSREVLKSKQLPAPRLGGLRRPRFDFAVTCDGKVNLQHARGETEMLASLDIISMIRSAETAPIDPLAMGVDGVKYQALQVASNAASRVAAIHGVEAQANALIASAVEQLLTAGASCGKLKGELQESIDGIFEEARIKLSEAIDKIPPFALAPIVGPLVQNLGRELYGVERTLRAPFDRLLADLLLMRSSALQSSAGVQKQALAQINSAADLVSSLVDAVVAEVDNTASRLLNVGPQAQQLSVVLASIGDDLQVVARVVNLPKLDTAELATARSACRKAINQLTSLSGNAVFGSAAKRCVEVLSLAQQSFADVDRRLIDGWDSLSKALKPLIKQLQQLNTTLNDAVDSVVASSKLLKDALSPLIKEINDAMKAAVAAIDESTEDKLAEAIEAASGKIREIHAVVQGSTQQAADDIIKRWRVAVGVFIARLVTEADKIDKEILNACTFALAYANQAAAALKQPERTADDWLKDTKVKATAIIAKFDCAQAERLAAELREVMRETETQIKDRLTGVITQLVDQSTRARLAELEGQATAVVGKVDAGIKLVKAMGELPELPTLTFNAERAEYVFDDLKKQIETSPFAAKLREIDSGLKELGIAIPSSQLLDQIIPGSLKDLDFSDVFKNIGAIDFNDLFKKFKLPKDLGSDEIKITQGVDKASRTAWVSTKVDTSFDKEESLFEFSGLAVSVAKMKVKANSDVRVGLNGEQTSKTDAIFSGDWGLGFGGTRLATFREVAVRFNGSDFDFDIEPSKVELHPAMKFVDEFAKRFKPELPPAIEIEKDSRGIPVGARAQMSTEVILPPLGIIDIGPMLINSGLAMRMGKSGQFEINANVSVGSKTAPIWVQVSYLGGGMWLEARASYAGIITYSASVGLAIGCIKAINVASVARGSFALLLFAYAEISNTGGSFRVGLSITGNARILGMANASVLMMLEATHSNGETKGKGTLDVKIEICWCYTLHVRREVDHTVN